MPVPLGSAPARHAQLLELLGHNTDVTFRGRVYHIQTESLPHENGITVTTLVYHQGSLLRKLETDHACDASQQCPADLAELVERHHLKVLAAIKKGQYA